GPVLAEPTASAVSGRPDNMPAIVHYAGSLARSAILVPLKAGPVSVKALRHPLGSAASAFSIAASVSRTVRPIPRPGSPIMLDRSIIRRPCVHEVPIAALRRAGRYGGGTVNDAFIAAVTAGLRRYHEYHGSPVSQLFVSMPISLRTPTDPMGGNQATLMRFDVPAAITDSAQRIRMIHEQTLKTRSEKSLAYTQFIAGALNRMPRWYVSSVLRHVDFVASDVPGFPVPVSFAGAAVRMQYAFSPTIGAAVNATLLSYVDTCAIGVNVDTAAIPDLDAFHDCLVAGFDEVIALAG
ncbi:MAG TPA: WS/DGAT domain-containing protein, partial [Microthrixaceae bacterium]|nr:WS/DGAT domain-containing protein [Microthrixaceae bacterium]